MKKAQLSMKKLYQLAIDYSVAKAKWIERNKWVEKTKKANLAKLKNEVSVIKEFLDFIWKERYPKQD